MDNIIVTNPPEISEAMFEQRFQHFLLTRTTRAKPDKRETLSKIKMSLNEVLELIQSTQHLSTILADNHQTMSDEDWAEASSTVVEQQKIVDELLANFAQPNRMQSIKKAIKKRRRKRNRLRNTIKPSPIPPPTIVQPIPPQPIIPSVLTHKAIISTQKTTEAYSFLALLDQLTELHRIRSQQSGRPCHTPSTLTHLAQLWTDAAEFYEQKERQNHQPTEKTSTDSVTTARQMWNLVLFGPTHQRRNTLHSEVDLARLIEIR